MSDFGENIRRLIAPPGATGFRAPSTDGVNPGEPRINTSERQAPQSDIAPIADYVGTEGFAQRGQGNDFGLNPQVRQEIRAYNETLISATVAGAVTVDCNRANIYSLTLSGNAALTMASPAALPPSQYPEDAAPRRRAHGVTLIVTQGGGGGKILTWPGNVKFAGGAAALLSLDAGSTDVFVLLTIDGGASWLCFESGYDFKVPA